LALNNKHSLILPDGSSRLFMVIDSRVTSLSILLVIIIKVTHIKYIPMYRRAILRTHIHRAAQHVPGWWIGSRPLSMEVVSVKCTSIMFEWDE
jgi:hypothetical protein